jgi:mannosyl-oligosaccharide alpha-1,2-mannosidase
MNDARPRTPVLPRRNFLRRALATSGFAVTGWASATPDTDLTAAHGAGQNPREIAKAVRAEFVHGWEGYKRAAYGHDEVLPVSGGHHEFFIADHPFGLSIIEALDTLYVMELDDDLAEGVRWLRHNLTFDVNGEVQVFEAIIRMVGGLLAGYYATNERFMLDAAHDLADRLLPAFHSPSGAPYRFVNLRTGAARGRISNLAEIGTNLLEFGDLSRLTGDRRYYDASKRAYHAVIKRRSHIGLLATNFDVEKGVFTDTASTAPNPPVDSFYEYLWGGWQMLGDTETRDWYRSLTKAVLRYQADWHGGTPWFRQVDYRTGKMIGHQQSELAAFYAELLAAGGDRWAGEAYYDSWTKVLTRYPLPPERIDYTTLRALDPGYQLRPEYANSAFDLWLLTHNERYRRTAHAHFVQMRDHCRVPGGYTILRDVRSKPVSRGDLTPAYWFAENMKYLYLLFADAPRFDYQHNYLSTEGKILRGLRPPR